MADVVAHETENTENKQNDANCDVTESVKKPETTVDEAGDAPEHKEDDEQTADDTDKEAASRKRKSDVGTEPDDGADESKKAKTDDKEVPPTNGSEAESNDKPEVTTKKVEDVQRLADDKKEVAA